jgi:hypothetical protein
MRSQEQPQRLFITLLSQAIHTSMHSKQDQILLQKKFNSVQLAFNFLSLVTLVLKIPSSSILHTIGNWHTRKGDFTVLDF